MFTFKLIIFVVSHTITVSLISTVYLETLCTFIISCKMFVWSHLFFSSLWILLDSLILSFHSLLTCLLLIHKGMICLHCWTFIMFHHWNEITTGKHLQSNWFVLSWSNQIWVSSPHNANGYFTIYGDESLHHEHFDSQLATGDVHTSYARTGFLGFIRRTELTQSDGGRPQSLVHIRIVYERLWRSFT